MATTSDDIDTRSIVGKYVSRQTTGVRLNADSNTAEENQAILESVAIAILLNPQSILSVILRAKNTLQQLITSDIELIDYITDAISETQNPDAFPTSTADLVNAQTALVELDRVGRIDTTLQAFTRYQNAIDGFLNKQLAPLVKRSQNGSFNRSGLEAKQDLFNSVGLFTQTHTLFIARLKLLAAAVLNFRGVDLSKVVHTQTIARVRTSLQQIKVGMDSGSMSNMVAALELMAGSSSLKAIANNRDLYDDTISLEDGYLLGPEPTSAFIESSAGPLLSTSAPHPHSATMSRDGGSPTSYEMPGTGKSGCPFVCNNVQQATFNIPVGYKLYVDVTPGASPGSDGITHYEISLTSGPARTVAQVITDINTAFATDGPQAADFDEAANSLIIFGDSSDSEVRIAPAGPGTFNTGTNVFTPAASSAHEILGFGMNQASDAVDSFDLSFLQKFFQANFGASLSFTTAVTLDDKLFIENPTTDPAVSAIGDLSALMLDFGFSNSIAVPEAMQIYDSTGTAQDPINVGVLIGSIVHAGAFVQTVESIVGSRILFDSAIELPLAREATRIVAPTVAATQATMVILNLASGQYDNDILPLQGLLSPLLSTPSLAQVNDALRAFGIIKTRLSGLFDDLSAIVVSDSQQPANAVMQSILRTLEERGFDRAQDLLSQCRFSEFFGLTSETVSKSTTFMKSMEITIRSDFDTSTVEEDMPDGNLLQGETPPGVLTRKEVP